MAAAKTTVQINSKTTLVRWALTRLQHLLLGSLPYHWTLLSSQAMEEGSLQKHPRSWHLAQYYWLYFTNYNCPINQKWRTDLTQWAGSTSQVKSVIMRPEHRASQATPGPVATSSQPPRLTSLPFFTMFVSGIE